MGGERCDRANLGRGPVTARQPQSIFQNPIGDIVAFRRQLTDNLRAAFHFAGRETA
jgi:hypothetical protein